MTARTSILGLSLCALALAPPAAATGEQDEPARVVVAEAHAQPDDEKPKTVDPDKKSIVVRITSRDRIIIAQRDVDWRSVRANIERLHAENPEGSVVIQPNRRSTNKMLVTVMDAARQAGVYNISLADERS